MTEVPALQRLVGAYLNEDWPELYGDVWAAVDDFIAGAPSLSANLPAEIDVVLTEYPSEAAVERFLDSLAIGYQPQPDEGGYTSFLREVSRRAASPAQAR